MPNENWEKMVLPEKLRAREDLYKRLVELAREECRRVDQHFHAMERYEQCFLQLFAKQVGCARAVLLLSDEGLIEHALASHRNLLEVTINMAYSLKHDVEEPMRRYDDWINWEVIRRIEREKPDPKTNKERVAAVKADLLTRYSTDELKRMERKGPFPGSLWDRAKDIDWLDKYESSYRTLSRNVHVVDVSELSSIEDMWGAEAFGRMMAVRLRHIWNEGFMCLGSMLLVVDAMFEGGLKEQVQALLDESKALKVDKGSLGKDSPPA